MNTLWKHFIWGLCCLHWWVWGTELVSICISNSILLFLQISGFIITNYALVLVIFLHLCFKVSKFQNLGFLIVYLFYPFWLIWLKVSDSFSKKPTLYSTLFVCVFSVFFKFSFWSILFISLLLLIDLLFLFASAYTFMMYLSKMSDFLM